MVDAVIPRWHGDNYQARVFWENALNLFDPTSCVIEVSFEADGPKAFDDVVIKYDPPVVRSGPNRISADYHQVKWHVDRAGRFGYADFIVPEFIGATSFSLLERLKQAQQNVPADAIFTFITTYRIRDDDPLARLVSGNDHSLLSERLFDKTTDRSKMGKVRKLWREHLQLNNDNELLKIISRLRIVEGYRSLEELQNQINWKAKTIGLISCDNSNSNFRYDELARKLKVRKLNVLTKEVLEKVCTEEGLFSTRSSQSDHFLKIAIRSFMGPAADVVGAMPEDTLLLTDYFRQRYLMDDLSWQHDIRPQVETFLRTSVRKSSQLRLILDAHASIAFLSGSILDMKSGVEVELIQKGRVGSRVWHPADKRKNLDPSFNVTKIRVGSGQEIAVAISISQSTESQAQAYIEAKLSNVGILVLLNMPSGPGHQNITGASHASALAEQSSNALREIKNLNPDALVHIFAACPNSFLFFFGQHHQGVAPCIVYEFDFDRRGNKTYQPSFIID
jgi:hypothetical protein